MTPFNVRKRPNVLQILHKFACGGGGGKGGKNDLGRTVVYSSSRLVHLYPKCFGGHQS